MDLCPLLPLEAASLAGLGEIAFPFNASSANLAMMGLEPLRPELYLCP